MSTTSKPCAAAHVCSDIQEGQSSVEAPSNIGANVSGTAGGYPPGPAGSSEAHLSDGAVATAAAFSAPPRLQIRPQVADKVTQTHTRVGCCVTITAVGNLKYVSIESQFSKLLLM